MNPVGPNFAVVVRDVFGNQRPFDIANTQQFQVQPSFIYYYQA